MGILKLIMPALLVLAACETVPSTDRLERFFDEITFGNAAGYEGQSASVVKWASPIRAGLSGVDADKYRDQVEKEIARFSRLTGIAVTWDQPANLTITLTADTDFLITRPGLSNEFVPCAVTKRFSPEGIQKADIIISVAQETSINRCIAHELAHAFGFGHHSGLLPSVLSPMHAATELTPWDELALRVLYDPAVRHGTSRADMMAIARERLARLRASK